MKNPKFIKIILASCIAMQSCATFARTDWLSLDWLSNSIKKTAIYKDCDKKISNLNTGAQKFYANNKYETIIGGSITGLAALYGSIKFFPKITIFGLLATGICTYYYKFVRNRPQPVPTSTPAPTPVPAPKPKITPQSGQTQNQKQSGGQGQSQNMGQGQKTQTTGRRTQPVNPSVNPGHRNTVNSSHTQKQPVQVPTTAGSVAKAIQQFEKNGMIKNKNYDKNKKYDFQNPVDFENLMKKNEQEEKGYIPFSTIGEEYDEKTHKRIIRPEVGPNGDIFYPITAPELPAESDSRNIDPNF